jgi:hypothetical protein
LLTAKQYSFCENVSKIGEEFPSISVFYGYQYIFRNHSCSIGQRTARRFACRSAQNSKNIHLHTGCLKENGPRYNFAIDDPNEKKYTGNKMALKQYKPE